MNGEKRLKDPIYGYISVPDEYINKIVDTAVFQRLRRIIQTSYSPLYSSAMHNRFVHSLGVYHLGRIAFAQIEEENHRGKFADHEWLRKMGQIFELACLLHDVGHAPFSHTGEIFYLKNGSYAEIHEQLKKYVDEADFFVPTNDSEAAAPHEIMSAVIGLKEFVGVFCDNTGETRSFFARCITGYLYDGKTDEEKIKNCLISLLNSKIIDVDKLDYLIRDAFITGFDTVHIDYVRLLSSLTIRMDNNGDYKIVYHKSALSVIENVIFAHDAERKWIQNHPVVVYESYLLYHMIRHLSEKIDADDKRLFSQESLSPAGNTLKDGIKVRLMSDDDIIYLVKNLYPFELGNEYFERTERRHPVWKSEAEYRTFFLGLIGEGTVLNEFEETIELIGNYLKRDEASNGVINDKMLERIQNDIPDQNDEELRRAGTFAKNMINSQIRDKQKMLKLLNKLKKYAEEGDIEFNFVILTAAQFSSGFGKPDFGKIEILFSSASTTLTKRFDDIAASFNARAKKRDKFFYLFYKRQNGEPKEFDCSEISRKMMMG